MNSNPHFESCKSDATWCVERTRNYVEIITQRRLIQYNIFLGFYYVFTFFCHITPPTIGHDHPLGCICRSAAVRPIMLSLSNMFKSNSRERENLNDRAAVALIIIRELLLFIVTRSCSPIKLSRLLSKQYYMVVCAIWL